ncbi:MAG: DUF5666 domain-containing protein [Acidobacteriota bacterium]
MKIRFLIATALGLALSAACGLPANAAPSPAQNPGGYGQRGGRGFGGMGMMGAGRGVTGTVTAVATDHFTVKSYEGQTYTVNFSNNTRILKQVAGSGGMGMRGNPPEQIKAAEIKVGDDITAMGQLDSSAKSVGAMMIMQLDPQRAQRMRAMMANYGKTWLMGKVTAIDGTKVTLMGSVDQAEHAFVADENTTFRERRNPITLADVHVGDTVRVDGAVKEGAFTAASVAVVVMPAGGMPRMPRNTPAQ